MDIDNGCVAAALAEGAEAVKLVEKYNLGGNYLKGNSALAWRFVQRHVREFGSVPTLGTLQKEVPDFRPPEEDIDRLEYYVYELKYRDKQESWERLGPDIGRLVVRDKNFDGAKERIKSFLREEEEKEIVGRETVKSLFSLTDDVRKRYEDMKAGKIGVPFPWPRMNDLTLGSEPGDNTGFFGRLGMGKSVISSTPCLTPDGWKPIGQLVVGDTVIGSNGKPTTVLGVFPQGVLKTYRVHMTDGTYADASGDHLWAVDYRRRSEQRIRHVLTTDQLRDRPVIEYRAKGQRLKRVDLSKKRLNIPVMSAPAEFAGNEASFSICPYDLGELIANGSLGDRSRITLVTNVSDWPEVRSRLSLPFGVEGKHPGCVSVNILGQNAKDEIARLGLVVKSEGKFIPRSYMTASVKDRIDLLHGLMDGDGHVSKERNKLSYSTCSEQLGNDVKELVQCLGGTASLSLYVRDDGSKDYVVRMRLPKSIAPFSVQRKLDRYKPGMQSSPNRSVDRVETLGEADCTCIKVDAEDSLFVIDQCVVTHNTHALLLSCHHAWKFASKKTLFISPEMKQIALAQRMFAYDLRLPHSIVRRGKLDDLTELKFFDELKSFSRQEGIWVVDDSFRITLDLIESAIDLIKPDAVYLDGVYMVLSEKGMSGRDNAEAVAVGMKSLAKRKGVPFIYSSQFNRTVTKNDPSTVTAEGVGISDHFGWFADNMFALVQTDDMRADREMAFKPIKCREADSFGDIRVRWDWDNQDFSEVGSADGARFVDKDYTTYGQAGADTAVSSGEGDEELMF